MQQIIDELRLVQKCNNSTSKNNKSTRKHIKLAIKI